MFLQQYHQSDKSSHIIMLALGISLVVHVLFVLVAQQEAKSIQSGSASRISVAMHWSNNIDVNDTEKKVQNIPQKAIPEISPKHELKSISAPKVVESTQSIRRVERITKIELPRVAKPISPIAETPTKPTQVKREINVTEIESKKRQDLAVQESHTTKIVQKHSSLESTEGQGESQTIRYELGSNNNPKPHYPSLAVKRGWQGQVVLGVHVNPDGSIKHLTFVKSTDYGVLNYEAYETVRTSWHFTPLEDETDLSKSSYIEVPITFNIANR